MLTFSAPKDLNLKVLQHLYDDEVMAFRFLTDLQAVHFPDKKGAELAVVYHLHNLRDNVRIRFKVYTDIQTPDVYSATALLILLTGWKGKPMIFLASIFIGHPNLIRVLNVEEMDYFP